MNQSFKKFFLPVLILIILLLLMTGIYFFSSEHTEVPVSDNAAMENLNIASEKKSDNMKPAAGKSAAKTAMKKFETKEEIRQEYGRRHDIDHGHLYI